MKLIDIARQLPQTRVEQINRESVWSGVSGTPLLEWPDVQFDREAVITARSALSPYASGALETVVRSFGPQPFDDERLLRAAAASDHWSGAELRQGLVELRRNGILFTIRKTWGDLLHFLPRDTFPFWLNAYFPHGLCPLAESEAGKLAERSGTDRQPLGTSLFGVLSVLYRHNADWTSRGVLPKKLPAKLVKRIAMDSAHLDDLELRFAYRDDYPAQLALLLDMAVALNWLEEDGTRYMLNESRWDCWLGLSAEQREARLIECFVQRYLLADAAAAHAAAAALFLCEGKWYRIADVLAWQEQFAPAGHNSVQAQSQRVRTILRVFDVCSWMEQAKTADGEAVFRWLTPPRCEEGFVVGEREEPLYIQPGGEIIVTREAGLRSRWKLEQIAELQSEDRAAIYWLKAQSVSKALDNGWTHEGIVRFLEEAQNGPLPATLAAALTDWTIHSGKLLLEEAVLLRCDAETTAERLLSEPSVAPFLRERIGMFTFTVDAVQAAELHRRLERLGLAPRKANGKESSASGNPSGPDKKVQSGSRGLFYDPSSLEHYSLYIEPESETELYPGLNQVPASWIHQLRTYHASTRKEMIQRAMSWHAPVVLRKDSETVAFIPLQLDEHRDGWSVSGRLRSDGRAEPVHIRLTPDMWSEMKLLIPGQTVE